MRGFRSQVFFSTMIWVYFPSARVGGGGGGSPAMPTTTTPKPCDKATYDWCVGYFRLWDALPWAKPPTYNTYAAMCAPIIKICQPATAAPAEDGS